MALRLFSPVAGRYDRLCEVLSLGQNRRWRRCMVDHAIERAPRMVLDVASGTAGVAIQMADRGVARVVAYDLTLPMLLEGARRVDRSPHRGRVQLVEGRAEDLPFPDDAFDAITFTYLLRYVDDPKATVTELSRALRPGGVMASLDFLVPPNRLWRAAWWCYTRLVLPMAGWATGGRSWWRVGRFLGPNITGHYRRHPVRDIVSAWEAAGLVDIGVRTMSLGGGLIMWGQKPDA
ncbi:MAG TPA: class I SAM-dependent methyltransferase [Acidimicrobiales bacterium]|nr:class I SAM-dependent methyltransferase [Acidimicrobiales bacterium]